MLPAIYGLFGIPPCARNGCPYPGIVRFEFNDENGPVWVNLCPMCLSEIKRCLGEVDDVREERRQALERQAAALARQADDPQEAPRDP